MTSAISSSACCTAVAGRSTNISSMRRQSARKRSRASSESGRVRSPRRRATVNTSAMTSTTATAAAAHCLHRTERLATWLWGAGAILYGVAGALLVMPTLLGFAYFLVSATIAAFPSVIWAYGAGKHLLIEHTAAAAALRYTGR